jgi:hypothetical protein
LPIEINSIIKPVFAVQLPSASLANRNQFNNQNPVFAVQLPSASPANRNQFNNQNPVFALQLPSASADGKRLLPLF